MECSERDSELTPTGSYVPVGTTVLFVTPCGPKDVAGIVHCARFGLGHLASWGYMVHSSGIEK